jgi:BirA family biotin operon repressor/biotin-[acetyl-CoA-carboxylase] ligase
MATLGFVAGLALEAAIRTATSPLPWEGGEVRLKWPNDVLVDGAKLSGILLQAVTDAAGTISVVVGIGVNVLHAPQGLPYPATSLAACGAGISAEQLFAALAETWVEHEQLWDGGRGFAPIRERWLERAAGLGEPITVRVGEDAVEGKFETIDEVGMLVVRALDGTVRKIAAGDVYFGQAATIGATRNAS